MSAPLVLARVSKSFVARGQRAIALNELSLQVAAGELLVLVGPSGCGKSTALRLIAGLDEPDAGSISLDGVDLARVPPQDRDVAMVFQGYALYPHLTVAENIAFPLKMRRVQKAERRRRVEEAAETVGLGTKVDRLPGELSGGERQRVAMARAIVRRPKLFLFDEPLSNLDAKLRAELRVELALLVRRLGATALYVTHDQAEAMTMGDRIAVLDAGVLQQIGSPQAIYHKPQSRFVAGFIGTPAMNFVELTRPGAIEVANFPRGATWVGFRPEALRLLDRRGEPPHCPTDGALSAEAIVAEATVAAVEPLGAETLVHLVAGSAQLVLRAAGFGGPAVGTKVAVAVATRDAHWFDHEGARVEP